MADDDDRAAILGAAKERARFSEEQHIVQLLADAIGERRDHDLLDLLCRTEQERKWPVTLKLLMRARECSYSLPVGAGANRTKIEDMKYREMLFSLLGCSGLEPIPTSTEEILARMNKERSLIDASLSLREYIKSVTKRQVESGDTLFFSLDDLDNQVSEDLSELLEHTNLAPGFQLVLERKDDEVDIGPLWQHEASRRILSEHGIKGNTIRSEKLEELLSVIQFPITVTDVDQYTAANAQASYPSSPAYRHLHNCIIGHDAEGLCILSSRHAFATLSFMLQEALDIYTNDPASENYRRVLNLVNMHVRVRTIDSLQLLEGLASSQDDRIATVAVTALSNFYHESTASILIELLCRSKKREIIKTASSAILNIGSRCPEAKSLVRVAAEASTCVYKGRLKRLLRELGEGNVLYY